MPYDFTDKQILTYAGINDVPEAPTATKAGNGSHLIALHNDLVLATAYSLNQLESAASKRCVVSAENYIAQAGDKVVLCDASETQLIVYIPELAEPGDEISLLHTNSVNVVTLQSDNGNPFIYKGASTTQLTFTVAYEFVSLIYAGYPTYAPAMVGWIPNKNVFTATGSI